MRWLKNLQEPLFTLPEPVYYHSACLMTHPAFDHPMIILFGGANPMGLSQTFILHIRSWKSLEWEEVHVDEEVRFPSLAHSSLPICSDEGAVMLSFGGQDFVSSNLLTKLSYKDESWSYEQVTYTGNIPNRSGHAAILMGRKMYMFGGYQGGDRTLNEVAVIDVDTYEASTISRPLDATEWPDPRWCSSVFAVSEHEFAILGGKSFPSTVYRDLWIFDTRSQLFREVKAPFPEDFLFTFGNVCLHVPGSRRVFVWGGSNDREVTDALWSLTWGGENHDTWEFNRVHAEGEHFGLTKRYGASGTLVKRDDETWKAVFIGGFDYIYYYGDLGVLDLEDDWKIRTMPSAIEGMFNTRLL